MLAIANLRVKPSYSVREVAAVLCASQTTVYRLIGNGEMIGFRLSRQRNHNCGVLRVDFESLVDFISTEPEEAE